jgi:uncharacterized protein (TIGR02231 family)
MNQIACESRIERVVVYARGAVVTRRVTLPDALPGEAVELRLAGITALAEPGSVRALAQGEREVTAVKARVVIPSAPVKTGRLRALVRALELEKERLAWETAYVNRRREGLGVMNPEPRFARWAPHADPAARFGDALALGALVGDELQRLDERLRAIEEASEDNQRRLAAAELAAKQGSTDDRHGDQRAELGVSVLLGGGPGALAALEIDYVVTAARWWPAYTARLAAAATRVSFGIDAFVAQASGEAWSGVALAVSTADLASDVRLPELRSLRIGRTQAAPRKGYRPPPAGLEAMFEGHDRAVNQGHLEQAPTDTGAVTRSPAFAAPESAMSYAPPPPPRRRGTGRLPATVRHPSAGRRECLPPRREERRARRWRWRWCRCPLRPCRARRCPRNRARST